MLATKKKSSKATNTDGRLPSTLAKQEPLGASYVDGLNLYRGYDSNPTNLLDPSGCDTFFPGSPSEINTGKAASDQAFDGGDVEVFVDGEFKDPKKRDSNGNFIIVEYLNKGKGCDTYHWLQLIKTTAIIEGTGKPFTDRWLINAHDANKKPIPLYRELGSTYIDADEGSSFYDAHALTSKNGDQLAIVDRPFAGRDPGEGPKNDLILDVSVQGDDYLLDSKGNAVWHVEWTRDWKLNYNVVASEPYKGAPPILQGDSIPYGSSNGDGTKPITLPNPLNSDSRKSSGTQPSTQPGTRP